MNLVCDHSNPLNATGTPPTGGDFWQYASTTCSIPYLTEIDNGEGQSFVVNSQMTYGDFLIFTVFIIFFVIWLAKHIWDFIVPISTKNLTKNDL